MIALTPDLIEVLDAKFGNVWISHDGDQVNVTCPFCHQRGKTRDQSGHMGLNFALGTRGMYHCVRCDAGGRDLISFLEKRGIPMSGARLRAMSLESVEAKGSDRKEWVGEVKVKLPRYTRRLTAREDFADPPSLFGHSLLKKNISLTEATSWALCACEYGEAEDYVIFPFFEPGSDDPVYWQGRDATGQKFLRKLNPTKLEAPHGKSHWLYGYDRAVRGGTAYLVEGSLDVISTNTWLEQNRGDGHFALGLQGTALSFPNDDVHPLNTQYGKLRALQPSQVFVLLDADAWKKAKALAEVLQRCGLRAESARLFGGDPNEAQEEIGLAIVNQGLIDAAKRARF